MLTSITSGTSLIPISPTLRIYKRDGRVTRDDVRVIYYKFTYISKRATESLKSDAFCSFFYSLYSTILKLEGKIYYTTDITTKSIKLVEL